VNFNRHSPLFTVRLIAEKPSPEAPIDEHYDYDTANTNEESELEAASLAF
jgi:hypothetical protein